MCDFDLSEALEGPSEVDEMVCESCCINMTDVQEEIFSLDEGLDLAISHDPLTMECVATLLLAVSRMKKSLTHRELREEELCSAIMDSLVEETIVKAENFPTGQRSRMFQRVNSVNLFTLCDEKQKDVVHESGGVKLQAITLKGGHGDRKVNFKLSRYITRCPSVDDGQPIVLSITNINLHISCSMKDDKPVLKLEECSEEDLNRIATNDRNMDRFLFYRRTRGISQITFESTNCRGWFISTSPDESQPLEMCEKDSATSRCLHFKIN